LWKMDLLIRLNLPTLFLLPTKDNFEIIVESNSQVGEVSVGKMNQIYSLERRLTLKSSARY